MSVHENDDTTPFESMGDRIADELDQLDAFITRLGYVLAVRPIEAETRTRPPR
jgi:hypothetical protein